MGYYNSAHYNHNKVSKAQLERDKMRTETTKKLPFFR